MKRTFLLGMCLLFALNGFAQTGINASLSGTVADVSAALIPGVEVTATNTGTGVASTSITNESGTYRFPSLQPGPYEVKASLTGISNADIPAFPGHGATNQPELRAASRRRCPGG